MRIAIGFDTTMPASAPAVAMAAIANDSTGETRPASTGRQRRTSSNRCRTLAVAPLALIVYASTAPAADTETYASPLEAAMAHYQRQEYDAARRDLAPLSMLGQAEAQGIYGAMLRDGQGGSKDPAAATGWMLAAASNGFEQLAKQSERLDRALGSLPPADQSVARDIVARFGNDAIKRTYVPLQRDVETCAGSIRAQVRTIAHTVYPTREAQLKLDADVALSFIVDTDGRAHEPDVYAAFPGNDDFAAPAVRALMRSEFTPAMVAGVPVQSIDRFNMDFRAGSQRLWDNLKVRRAIDDARAGAPGAAYMIGTAALADPKEFGLEYGDSVRFLLKAAQAGIPEAQYRVWEEIARHRTCAPSAKAANWLAAAVNNGNGKALLARARQLLAAPPSPEQRSEAKRLLQTAARSPLPRTAQFAVGILATSPYEDVRDDDLIRSLSLPKADGTYDADPLHWELTAAIDAARGRFDDAVSHEKRAIKLATEYAWNTRAMEQRLAEYAAGRAWTGELLAPLPIGYPVTVAQ